jgi:dedicator of cytokinesis protein 6/7/8
VDPILKLTLDGKVNHYSSGSSVIVEISNLNKVKESYIVDSLQVRRISATHAVNICNLLC